MSNIISIALILASAGIFFGYINPTYGATKGDAELHKRSIQELWEEREHYTDALEKTREIEQARTGLLEKYNRIPPDDRERIEKLLPDHIDSVRLIIDINTLASQYDLILRNITLIDAQAKTANPPHAIVIGPREERFKAVGLKFAVSGSYDAFRSFLKDLEQSLRLVDVEVIAFSAQTGSDYEYRVTLSTYRLNAVSAPGF